MTPSSNPSTTYQSDTNTPRLRAAVSNSVNALQGDFLQPNNRVTQARARAVLAQLRKYGSLPLADQPLALEEILLLLQPSLSEWEVGRGDKPSPSELAAFHALTTFGVHMQGTTVPMHTPDRSFASSCGHFYAQSESKSTKPRFDAMMATNDDTARLVHIRSLVTLLRGIAKGFDYGLFAQDLRVLLSPTLSQDQHHRRQSVLLRWGRDFATGAYTSTSS
ncbi:CRISPR-associated protein Cse2 [Corynebacterium auriscanis]|uniref:CRISPR-associated protein Cse2 n=2 Tax=Corynebacterium auriscanis TaxID=99807 RepID=A0A0A2DGP0_9CORY|nr:CRISPR-associated protein Cse2 [Corynebacterium auriscanis]WJY73768.1 CRISPR-associated protein Cse2 [Corynebacterium auriscanis]